MKLLVDEHNPLMTVFALRELGHDVLDIRGTPEEGLDDPALFRKAQLESRLLITTDKGFFQYRDRMHCGLLIVRLRRPNRYRIHGRIMHALGAYVPHEWRGLLVVLRDVAQGEWRIRDDR